MKNMLYVCDDENAPNRGKGAHNFSGHMIKGQNLIDRSSCIALAMGSNHRLLEPLDRVAVVSVIKRVFPQIQTISG